MFTFATECGRRSPLGSRRRSVTGTGSDLALPVPGRQELQAMAEGMAESARLWPGMASSTTRHWELLASSETFEAWVIGWPPGGIIELHDHGDSAGAVTVATGELVETLATEEVDGSVTTTSRRMRAGTSWTMVPRHIHDVVNDGSCPAVSVHVYAPRLTAMTHYRIVNGLLQAEKTVHYRLGAVVP